ncbi:MAG: lamin tail domain-containing protein [Patescibacteria group bacterium]
MKKLAVSLLVLSLMGEFFIGLPSKAESPTVLISEICTDPQSDWSTNDFNGTAGDGSVTSSDEYLEIVNVSIQNIDLTGWTIKYEDSQVDVDQIDVSLVKNETVEGDITQFQPNQYYILGNPVGSMNNDLRVELYDSLGNLIDRVTLGDWDDGNLEDNAPDGNAGSADDEVVARNYNNQDSEIDQDDWQKTIQTMGQQNPEWAEEEEEEEPEPEEEPIDEEPPQLEDVEYSDQIIISEVMPNPEGSDTEAEFIELQNLSDQDVDLANWILGDASSRTSTLKKGDLESTVIPASGFFPVWRSQSGIALNNSGDKVVLYHPDQNIVDEVEYGKSFEGQSYAKIEGQWKWTSSVTPGELNSFQIQNESPEAKIEVAAKELKVRQPFQLSATGSEDPDGDELIFTWTLGDDQAKSGSEIEYSYQNEGEYQITLIVEDIWGATGQAEIMVTVTDYDYSDKVVINELLPNPEENDKVNEWIELINLGQEPVDLEGWKLTDKRTDYIWPAHSVIEAQEFLVVNRPESKIGLNNSGDQVFLVDPAARVINGVEYQSAKAGLSFAREDKNNWRWTDTPTEGKQNLFSLEEERVEETADSAGAKEPMIVSLKQVSDLESGDLVVASGVVTVEPGVLGKSIFYINDETGGAQIYCSGDCPAVDVNDQIEVAGKISISQGHPRIKVTKEEVTVLGQQEVEVELVAIADIVNHLNNLVRIEGQVLSVEQSDIYIADDDGETIKVYLKRSTGLKKSVFSEGQNVSVIGIVEPNKDEIRLLPRYESDIEIQGAILGAEQENLDTNQIDLSQPEQQSNKLPMIITLVVIMGGAGGYYFWKKKIDGGRDK